MTFRLFVDALHPVINAVFVYLCN